MVRFKAELRAVEMVGSLLVNQEEQLLHLHGLMLGPASSRECGQDKVSSTHGFFSV